MLVVIAILAAILFPVFQKVRENARRASCQSNMKQIGIALVQYVQDSDEIFLLSRWESPAPAFITGQTWANNVYPFINSVGVFHCPDDAITDANGSMDYFWSHGPGVVQFHTSYLYNTDFGERGDGCYTDLPAILSKLAAPATTVLAVEGASDADPAQVPSAWSQTGSAAPKKGAFLISSHPDANYYQAVGSPGHNPYTDQGGPLPRHNSGDGLNVL